MPNPENLTPFKPGQSGNPEGRPKGSRNLSTILKAMLEEEVLDDSGVKKPFQDIIIAKLVKLARDGDLKAIQEIYDRVEGKSQSNIKVEVNEPIKSFLIEPASNKDK